MQKAFDDFIMVDWSAASSPSPKNPDKAKDSIWLARLNEDSRHFRTRIEFFDAMREILQQAIDENKRVLCGFDFCFGLPRGAVGKLRKSLKDKDNIQDWLWLWRYLDEKITDDEKNRNNRWLVASEMNRRLSGGQGPFWGCPKDRQNEYLSEKKNKSIFEKQFHEKRKTEKWKSSLSVWQLTYTGAVGGQSLLGMAYLQRLRLLENLAPHIRIYPFEDIADAPIVFAESYYGLADLKIDETIIPKDKGQVEAAVRFCAEQQKQGTLGEWLAYPNDPEILEDEGWTFTQAMPKDMEIVPQKAFAKPAKTAKLPALTPDEIYAQSFADIKRLSGITGNSLKDKIRRRMIHACGDIDIADDIIIRGNFRSALRPPNGAFHIIGDCNMVVEGLIKKSLPKEARVISAIKASNHKIPKTALIPTRSAVAMEKIAAKLAGSIVIIGNAPTALERLLYGLTQQGWQKPALIIATPVGFVGAAESKQALLESSLSNYITLCGRKGGSAIAAAACNAILLHRKGDKHG